MLSIYPHSENKILVKITHIIIVWCCVVMKQGRKEDAVLFAELHRRMNSQGVWHNGWAILHLLLVLSDEHVASPAHSIVSNGELCIMHIPLLLLCKIFLFMSHL